MQQTTLTDYLREIQEEDRLILQIIENDKVKKQYKIKDCEDEDYMNQMPWEKEKRQKYAMAIKEFDRLLKEYLERFGPSRITCIIVREYLIKGRWENYEKPLQNFGDEIRFDTRFGYYQFIKFKFLGFSHVCATMPFVWFTMHFAGLDPKNKWMPEVNDTQTGKILLLKEAEKDG